MMLGIGEGVFAFSLGGFVLVWRMARLVVLCCRCGCPLSVVVFVFVGVVGVVVVVVVDSATFLRSVWILIVGFCNGSRIYIVMMMTMLVLLLLLLLLR